MRIQSAAIAIALIAAGQAAPQDTIVTVQETTEANRFVMIAEFQGALPAGATRVDVVWSDIVMQITGDAPVTIDSWNPGYTNGLTGEPILPGNGTSAATFFGTMLGSAVTDDFGGPPADSSNPLLAFSFTYAGTIGALGFELTGQNSIVFEGNPANPFGTPEFYMDAQLQPGTRTLEFVLGTGLLPVEQINFFIPAPTTLALLTPAAALLARRRR